MSNSASTVKMGVHIGNALKYVTDNYPTLLKVILELIQNSLDSEATEIKVILDYKTGTLAVRDNGIGISQHKFEQAISSVCSSLKTETGKLGQFGIGLLSPLGKCKGFLITSAERSAKHEYNRWVFDSEKILKSPNLPEIPVVPMPDIFYTRAGGKTVKGRLGVDWRTEVVLEYLSKDKSVSAVNLIELRSLILGQFSEPMRRLNAEVSLIIKRADKTAKEISVFRAASFSGERLGEVVYGNLEVGRTSFDMYLSPKTKTGRKGSVLIGIEGNDFRLPFSIFAHSTPEMDSEVVNILNSGVFEGCILSSNCLLHPNRKEFVDNEARLMLLIHLESWVKNHGRKQVAAMKDTEKDAWLQAVGSIAISQLEENLRNQMPYLLEVVKSFKVGTIGSGHNGYDGAKQEQVFPSAQKRQPADNEDQAPHEESKSPNPDREPTLHPGHTPFKVAGDGQKRRTVRGHSTGLQFVFEELPGNDNHWEFDGARGILTFNTRSDIWAKMEVSERNLILYQQYVAIKALELQLQPTPVRQSVFEFLQKELKSASVFISTSAVTPARRAHNEVGRRFKKKS